MTLRTLRRRYLEWRLRVRQRGSRKRVPGTRRPTLVWDAMNRRWSLNLVGDAFTDGRQFRVLAVVDNYSRDCLALVADASQSSLRVARELDVVIARRGLLAARTNLTALDVYSEPPRLIRSVGARPAATATRRGALSARDRR